MQKRKEHEAMNKKMKRHTGRRIPVAAASILLSLSMLTACTSGQEPIVIPQAPGATTGTTTETTTGSGAVKATTASVRFDGQDLEGTWDAATAKTVTLNGDSIAFAGEGATVEGSTITITASGTYVLSGTLDDGQVIVDAGDEDTVRLVLNGASITRQSSAPIYVKNDDKTIITLAEGTVNSVTDGEDYVLDDVAAEEPNAAIFLKTDLIINGTGSLKVEGNYNHGIATKDDIKIISGTLVVDAVTDGIKGRDYVAVRDGDITITAGSDGIQSSHDEDPEKGFIYIENGMISITAGADGIQAETSLLVKGGDITVTTGSGSGNTVTTTAGMGRNPLTTTDTAESMKGLKAKTDLTIEGGTINIDAEDDAVHSNDSVTVNGGTLIIASGDDGIHGDSAVTINNGEIAILKAYEGIESAKITINDGNIHVGASDDGINTSGGSDGSSVNGRPGQNGFNTTDGSFLQINGGYVVVDAQGDGIDVNGDFVMNAGTVLVNGPTNSGNGALDYNGDFQMNGGFLIAAGSAGMAQAPGTASAQHAVKVNLTSQAAGSLVRIEAADGTSLVTFAPTKTYQSVVVSSPELKEGTSYTAYTGGASTGTGTDGLYEGGSYSGGTEAAAFTISAIVTEATQAGATTGGMGGQGRPGRNGGTFQPPTQP
jgi:hypothetical protein